MKSNEELLQDYIRHISGMHMIHAEDIPSIQLYMDQVTTFINERLATSKRYEEDKIMTKTMINNYAKNSLLPPPDKKKYSKEHMILLLFIYYFKSILSITDIQTLLTPITEKFFQSREEPDLSVLYETIRSLEVDSRQDMMADLSRTMEKASGIFQDTENPEELQRFAFICLVSYDVYMKKMLLEQMVDAIRKEQETAGKSARK
jgi:DNA-binding transcriptional MerR regulator